MGCAEPRENQGPVDPWVTLESRVRPDPEDFLAYLAFQDPQDQLVSKETGDSLGTLGLQVSEKRDLRVQRDHLDHLGHQIGEPGLQGFRGPTGKAGRRGMPGGPGPVGPPGYCQFCEALKMQANAGSQKKG